MPPALVVDGLTVSARGRRLVAGVSFHVGQGERVALLGASGSGKSLTAAAVLGSLDRALTVSGEVRLAGERVPAVAPTGRTGRVAAVYQDSRSALNPLVRVGAQLVVPLRRCEGSGRRAATEAAAQLLVSVGLDDPHRVLASFPAELSGGQCQRVCLALALACRARILVADEPTTALDVVTQARVLDVLRGYGDEHRAALLFITHDLTVAASLCDRAVVLQRGRVVEEATMADLVARPQHAYTRALVAAALSRRTARAS